MLQEIMRAVVLLVRGEDASSSEELAHLLTILERASRACAGRELEELEATASGKPQPEHT